MRNWIFRYFVHKIYNSISLSLCSTLYYTSIFWDHVLKTLLFLLSFLDQLFKLLIFSGDLLPTVGTHESVYLWDFNIYKFSAFLYVDVFTKDLFLFEACLNRICLGCRNWSNFNIKGKPGKVKWWNMLKRRNECDTYLTHVCRHRWSKESLAER